MRNSLADPFILGVSSGAAAFATLGMLFGAFSFLGTYSLSISAFLGAAVTIIFVYLISRVRGRINITQLLLSGVAISMIMDGVTSIIKLGAPNALGLHNAEFWMSGSLAGAQMGLSHAAPRRASALYGFSHDPAPGPQPAAAGRRDRRRRASMSGCSRRS